MLSSSEIENVTRTQEDALAVASPPHCEVSMSEEGRWECPKPVQANAPFTPRDQIPLSTSEQVIPTLEELQAARLRNIDTKTQTALRASAAACVAEYDRLRSKPSKNDIEIEANFAAFRVSVEQSYGVEEKRCYMHFLIEEMQRKR